MFSILLLKPLGQCSLLDSQESGAQITGQSWHIVLCWEPVCFVPSACQCVHVICDLSSTENISHKSWFAPDDAFSPEIASQCLGLRRYCNNFSCVSGFGSLGAGWICNEYGMSLVLPWQLQILSGGRAGANGKKSIANNFDKSVNVQAAIMDYAKENMLNCGIIPIPNGALMCTATPAHLFSSRNSRFCLRGHRGSRMDGRQHDVNKRRLQSITPCLSKFDGLNRAMFQLQKHSAANVTLWKGHMQAK